MQENPTSSQANVIYFQLFVTPVVYIFSKPRNQLSNVIVDSIYDAERIYID